MSINPSDFYDNLLSNGINFFTGVPDSLLKEFCLCVDKQNSFKNHIIAANEGNAISVAAGHYLGSQSIPLVYMQNSGLGNAVNPLMSLCDTEVYSIPMILMIGWRGEPGVNDEPQHVKQGKIQLNLLDTIGIPFEIIGGDSPDFEKKINKIVKIAKNKNCPVALLIKKGTFAKYSIDYSEEDNQLMMREEAIEIILENLNKDVITVSTTGKTSREIFETRERNNETHEKDFLTVGSMGHCSSIALGIAIAKKEKKVICIDGDGSIIMHAGSMSTIGELAPANFYHILINNKVHESVGGQKTAAENINFPQFALASGYNNAFVAINPKTLKDQLSKFFKVPGPNFLEIIVKPGSRENLGRPTIKPINNKLDFIKYVNQK